MDSKSFIAHNGVNHLKPSSTEKSTISTTETQTDSKLAVPNSQTITPESNSTSEQQVLEVPKTKTESLTTKQTNPSLDLDKATLVPGFGESIFTLLIVSPFLLLGFKKWLHR